MNENIQNKKLMLNELETLLSGNKTVSEEKAAEMSIYCEYMKKFYLSCSTNN